MKNNEIILVILLLMTISLQAQEKALLNFKFNNNLKEANNQLKGISQNNVLFTEDRYGNTNAAIAFNGLNSFLKIPFNINSSNYPKLTVLAWVKVNVSNKRMMIFSNDDGGFDRSFGIDNRDRDWKFSVFCGDGGVRGGSNPLENKWTFIACTFDQGKGQNKIYINGKMFSKNGRHNKGLDFFHLGSNPSYGEFFNGSIDDFRLFDGVLSEAEIIRIYKKESKNSTIPSNLKQVYYSHDEELAEIVIRVGDIDNLGFGWPENFNPFSGNSTPIHPYPWKADPNDYPGTDRISVGRSFIGGNVPKDGYTKTTRRPNNYPSSITIKFPKPKQEIRNAVLQLFVDDFQSPYFKSYFQVRIDNKRIPYLEEVINALNQTGPIGKLISLGLLKEDLELLKDGKIEISIDDSSTGAGDGFAIDFVKLLINPRGKYDYSCNILGKVIDQNGMPIPNALVSNGGISDILTDTGGRFKFKSIPAGLNNVVAKKIGYDNSSTMVDIADGETKKVTITLKDRKKENVKLIAEELKQKGKIDLYGILFDSNKHIPKRGSEQSLNATLEVLHAEPSLKIKIIGHTDSDGKNAYNEALSRKRATSVVNWLVKKGISRDRLIAVGKGESTPVSNNSTEEGKSLNRRVELEVAME